MAEVLNPFGPSSLLFDLHLRDLMHPADGKILPLSLIMPFGEWRLLSLHIYVDMDVHGFFLSATPLYGRILFVTKPTLTTYLT